MRKINEIIVHCTATRPEWMSGETSTAKVEEIRRWHMSPPNNWRNIGYHFIIDRDGTVKNGRPIEETGTHVKGHNTGTVGVSLIGGFGGVSNGEFLENFTLKQDMALRKLLINLKNKYPSIKKISGHNEYASKACPCFNVTQYLNKRTTLKSEK